MYDTETVSSDEQEQQYSEEDINSSDHGSTEEHDLLGSWKEREDESKKLFVPKRPWSRSLIACIAVTAGISLGAYVIVGFFLHLNGATTWKQSGGALSIRSNDYVLEPNWNTQSLPQRREYTWEIKDHVFNPDGIYREMILVNGQYPGPLVEANEGDTIVVHVDNQAINATAIHWHGIYQNGTPHMDGTVGVSQCPIAPGGKFTYEFTVSGQGGTYWWHAHHGVQSSDGLHGPLVIHDRKERELQQLDYATDRVILVSDHYHDLSSALLWQYLKPDMENAEPVPDGALINGHSIQNCDDFPHRKCDNTSTHVGIPTLDLAPDQNHRLRFINVGAFAEFQLQVDEHQLAVTEVDGTDVLPINYHRVNISPAQRYSVVIRTNATGDELFWLRARMITQCFTDPPRDLKSEVRAVVRYHGSRTEANEEPVSVDWDQHLELECKDMDSSELVPVEILPAPVKADAFFYLRSNFEIGVYRLSRGFFNSSSWRPNVRSPSLLRSINGITASNATFTSASSSPPGSDLAFVNDAAFDISRELIVQTTGIQTIDILVSNFDDGNHPFHLHGYKYFVLAQGHGYPPLTHVGADINPQNLAPLYDSLDLSNPLRRDTASVEAFGWILLRIIADNPGSWAFHCHLAWHSEAGLLMQFLTRSEELAHMQVPPTNLDLCSAAGLEKGLGPEDKVYRDIAK